VKVLVIDIGGSNVKLLASGQRAPRKLKSGEKLTPKHLARELPKLTKGWKYDVIALGYPGRVGPEGPEAEPGNLGRGWTGFDYQKAFKRPIRIVNDAALQALGAYEGGRMLFLGLGPGVGSAIVTDRVVVPLELGDLLWTGGTSLFGEIGKAACKRDGTKKWSRKVFEITDVLRKAMHADYVVLGGGNAKHVHPLPPHTRRGSNRDAFKGGFRLWEETFEPHDREPKQNVWRVCR
jgi:polyphosphate glucokinase